MSRLGERVREDLAGEAGFAASGGRGPRAAEGSGGSGGSGGFRRVELGVGGGIEPAMVFAAGAPRIVPGAELDASLPFAAPRRPRLGGVLEPAILLASGTVELDVSGVVLDSSLPGGAGVRAPPPLRVRVADAGASAVESLLEFSVAGVDEGGGRGLSRLLSMGGGPMVFLARAPEEGFECLEYSGLLALVLGYLYRMLSGGGPGFFLVDGVSGRAEFAEAGKSGVTVVIAREGRGAGEGREVLSRRLWELFSKPDAYIAIYSRDPASTLRSLMETLVEGYSWPPAAVVNVGVADRVLAAVGRGCRLLPRDVAALLLSAWRLEGVEELYVAAGSLGDLALRAESLYEVALRMLASNASYQVRVKPSEGESLEHYALKTAAFMVLEALHGDADSECSLPGGGRADVCSRHARVVVEVETLRSSALPLRRLASRVEERVHASRGFEELWLVLPPLPLAMVPRGFLRSLAERAGDGGVRLRVFTLSTGSVVARGEPEGFLSEEAL